MNSYLDNLIGRGKTFLLNQSIKLTHRTKNNALSIDQIDPTAIRKTKQGRKGQFVGFYTYNSSEESQESSNELDVRYGSHKIDYALPAGSKVLDLSKKENGEDDRGATSKIGPEVASFLLNNGYSAIVGYDYVGPLEWVILKLVISGKEAEFIETSKASNVKESALRDFIRETVLSGYSLKNSL